MVARCWKVVVGVLGKLLWVCWDSCCGCVADRCTTVLFVSGVCVSLLSSPLSFSPQHTQVQSSDSLSKAKNLIKAIHKSPNKNASVLLLGNKTDVARNSTDAIRKAHDFCRQSKVFNVQFAYGSTNRNEFELNDENMDVYNLMNDFVQIINGKNGGVDGTEYDARFAKSKKRGRGRGGKGTGGIDDDDDDSKGGGFFSCFQMCNCFGKGEEENDGDGDQNV